MLIVGGNQSAGGYNIDNSLRFNDGSSDYLTKTFGSAGNRKTWTWSGWVKRSGGFGVQQVLFGTSSGASTYHLWYIDSNDGVTHNYDGANISSSAKFRDTSAWYHFVCAVDTTQSTAADRVKMYVNGSQITSFDGASYPSQNADLSINNNIRHDISNGGSHYSNNFYFDGYMSEVVFIDGTALDPTSFGEFDADTGIWKPIAISGLTFGTNGFYLKFANSASLGTDSSGNGNNFTVNNLTSIDQTTDTPTNNFATLNPLIKSGSPTYANGNTEIASIGDNDSVVSSIGTDTMKFYFEVKLSSTYDGSGGGIDAGGLREEQFNASGFNSGTWSGFSNAYTKFYGNGNDGRFKEGPGTVVTGGLTRAVAGDIVMIAIDPANNRVYAGVNGTWLNSSDPVAGTGYIGGTAATGTGIWFGFHSSDLDKGDCFVNYGNPAYTISSGNSDANGYGNFEYAVPSGYYALCTKNLAEFG